MESYVYYINIKRKLYHYSYFYELPIIPKSKHIFKKRLLFFSFLGNGWVLSRANGLPKATNFLKDPAVVA